MCTMTLEKENEEMEKPGAEEGEEEEGEEEEGQEVPILEPMEEDVVSNIEQILGYIFGEKKLLAQALTHGSFYNPGNKVGPTYERLEFLGDAVLGVLMAREVFFSYASLPPGQLTLLRGANVDTERLARIAVESNLHSYLRHKAPQLECQIQEFMEGMLQYPIHSNGLLDPPKQLADIVEAVIGAIFIDSNSSLETVEGIPESSRPIDWSGHAGKAPGERAVPTVPEEPNECELHEGHVD